MSYDGFFNGAATLLGNVLSNKTSEDIARSTNKYNLRLMQMQNEYNKPINQVARLKEAGLNPALVYGHGGVANTSATPTPASSPTVRYDLGQAIENALNFKQIKANIDNLQATNSNIRAQNRNLETDNKIKEEELKRQKSHNKFLGVGTKTYNPGNTVFGRYYNESKSLNKQLSPIMDVMEYMLTGGSKK